MKKAIWILVSLLGLLWTSLAWLLGSLSDWLARALASGEAGRAGQAVAEWPLPDWLAVWIDAERLRALQALLLDLLDRAQSALPLLGSALQWLEPMIWVLWALGLGLLLLLGGLVHWWAASLPAAGRAVEAASR